MTCLISYDIENDKMRAAVFRYLKGRGQNIQKSVFLVEAGKTELEKIKKDIEEMVAPSDSVLVIGLCASCRRRAVKTGKQDDLFFVF